MSTFLAGAENAVKDEANGFKFAKFIEAVRRSLTAFGAQATALVASASKVRHADNAGASEIQRENLIDAGRTIIVIMFRGMPRDIALSDGATHV